MHNGRCVCVVEMFSAKRLEIFLFFSQILWTNGLSTVVSMVSLSTTLVDKSGQIRLSAVVSMVSLSTNLVDKSGQVDKAWTAVAGDDGYFL
ncbi:MAG: hypothetical protein DYH05_04330 [Acidobacteria bacterium ACB1]|nr:hypothetical protein [Acidobacteria bacterium ACB1]